MFCWFPEVDILSELGISIRNILNREPNVNIFYFVDYVIDEYWECSVVINENIMELNTEEDEFNKFVSILLAKSHWRFKKASLNFFHLEMKLI